MKSKIENQTLFYCAVKTAYNNAQRYFSGARIKASILGSVMQIVVFTSVSNRQSIKAIF